MRSARDKIQRHRAVCAPASVVIILHGAKEARHAHFVRGTVLHQNVAAITQASRFVESPMTPLIRREERGGIRTEYVVPGSIHRLVILVNIRFAIGMAVGYSEQEVAVWHPIYGCKERILQRMRRVSVVAVHPFRFVPRLDGTLLGEIPNTR